MADIKNKNELKRRIDLFLDELDYSINEKFCKETMKMMKEFIGHASHRLDCEDSRVKSLKKKLKDYKDLEEQGLLLRLPFKVGDIIYEPVSRNTINEYRVTGIKKEAFSLGIEWELENGFIYQNINGVEYQNIHGVEIEEIGKTVFLTREEAEQKLKEMED